MVHLRKGDPEIMTFRPESFKRYVYIFRIKEDMGDYYYSLDIETFIYSKAGKIIHKSSYGESCYSCPKEKCKPLNVLDGELKEKYYAALKKNR